MPPRCSPVRALTTQIVETYRRCAPPGNARVAFTSSDRPRRYLTNPSEGIANDGMDNCNLDLLLFVGMEMLGRFVVIESLGAGAFGQVVLCNDLMQNRRVAIKVTKNHPSYCRQAQSEIDVLYFLQCCARTDPRARGLVAYEGSFIFCNHICLVFEVLGCNLFEVLKANSYVGLSLAAIRHILRQVITSLLLLQQHSIAHCDIKPENILLVSNDDAEVRLIDFGSACNEHATLYTYIQSRFYRAPEVICAAPYDCRIDSWSLGCVMAEMFLGVPLFPGVNEYHQMCRIVEMVGYPSQSTLHCGRDTHKFFKRVVPEAAPDPAFFMDEFYVAPHEGFQLRSEAEYCEVVVAEPMPFKRYFNYRYLGDLIFHYPMVPGISEDEAQRERIDRLMFLDMLRGMLNPVVEERWRAPHVAGHPFLNETVQWSGEGQYHKMVVLPEVLRYAQSGWSPVIISPDANPPQVNVHGRRRTSLTGGPLPSPMMPDTPQALSETPIVTPTDGHRVHVDPFLTPLIYSPPRETQRENV